LPGIFVWRRGNCDQVLSAAKCELADACLVSLLERLSNYRECFVGVFRLGRYEVRLFVKYWREVLKIDELRQLKGGPGFDAQIGNFIRLNNEIFSLAIFVPFYDLRVMDGSVVTDNIPVMDSEARPTIDLMKGNLARRVCGREQVNAKGDQRNLHLTGPIRTRHYRSLHGGIVRVRHIDKQFKMQPCGQEFASCEAGTIITRIELEIYRKSVSYSVKDAAEIVHKRNGRIAGSQGPIGLIVPLTLCQLNLPYDFTFVVMKSGRGLARDEKWSEKHEDGGNSARIPGIAT